MKRSNKPELLAPAGDFDCLKAAVSCGADAVYVGSDALNARMNAKNFNRQELAAAVDYCHLRGSKLYLALNTLVFDREIKALLPFLRDINDIGVDSVILQDIGLAHAIHQMAPELAMHASTQMTVHTVGGAKAALSVGFQRAVLARELSAEEISAIVEQVPIETEIFVHGALCVCYSGQCQMSSFLGGRSGNRGRCAQPCRLPYQTAEHPARTILSPKDYCLLDHLPKIKRMGVTSLKMEGRMKGPAYVETVTSIYRKYLDSNAVPTDSDRRLLQSAFDRGGYTDGYFTGSIGRDMFCFQKPENPYLSQPKRLEVSERKISISMQYHINRGEAICLTAKTPDGAAAQVISDFKAEPAQKTPTSEERILEQLSKTGDTVYLAKKLEGVCDADIFIPIAELNRLRRELLEQLDEIRLKRQKDRPFSDVLPEVQNIHLPNAPRFTVEVANLTQLEAVRQYDFARYYIPAQVADRIQPDDIPKERLYFVLPRIMKDGEISQYQARIAASGIRNVVLGNLGHAADFLGNTLHGDLGLNITNSLSGQNLRTFGFSSYTISAEADARTVNGLRHAIPCEYVIYGKLPLMITENCIASSTQEQACCVYEKQSVTITDRKNETFTLQKSGLSCRSEIFNAIPLFLADKRDALISLKADFLRLKFTDETPEQCRHITECYLKGVRHNLEKITRGYFEKTVD